jgi:hypothetical protein
MDLRHTRRMIAPRDINLEELIASWHGSPSARPEESAIQNHRLPAPLRDWYAQSARWSQPLMKFMRMYTPDQIRRWDDKEIFMEDSEGDWRWAFDSKNMESIFEAELHGDWHIVNESLSYFITHCVVIDATITASFWRQSSHVEPDLLGKILAPMSEVSFAKLQWPVPGGRVFISQSMIATVLPTTMGHPSRESAKYVEVRVAAVESSQLDYLDGIKSVSWKRYPRAGSLFLIIRFIRFIGLEAS